jgi:hypothetical protein
VSRQQGLLQDCIGIAGTKRRRINTT